MTRGLGWAPLVRLGAISYSIYLVHYPIIVITALALRLGEHMTGMSLTTFGYTGLDHMVFVSGPSKWLLDGVMLVYLAVVIAVATLSCRLIEAPGRDIINGASLQRSPWALALRASSRGNACRSWTWKAGRAV